MKMVDHKEVFYAGLQGKAKRDNSQARTKRSYKSLLNGRTFLPCYQLVLVKVLLTKASCLGKKSEMDIRKQ